MNDMEPTSQEAVAACPLRQWREDFPIEWDNDHYVTRRELTKFLTLGSALLAGGNCALAAAAFLRRQRRWEPARIAALSDVAPGASLLFRYPTNEDPCILLRDAAGKLQAFSQVCTHLSCAVIYEASEKTLFCPCHHGYFSPETGTPTGGPPTRPLPRITLEQRGEEIYAIGIEG